MKVVDCLTLLLAGVLVILGWYVLTAPIFPFPGSSSADEEIRYLDPEIKFAAYRYRGADCIVAVNVKSGSISIDCNPKYVAK